MNSKNKNFVLWTMVLIYAAATLVFPFLTIPTYVYALLAVLLGTVFALLHGSMRYGVGGIAAFAVICLVISNILENISILTGFPFGRYYYTDGLGIKLFAVPILIGPAYFSTGYLSFTIGNILADFADRSLTGVKMFLLPLIAAFVMVMWDLVMDPSSSTIGRLWIWQNGGGYFGVPLSNYLGWFFTVYLFFQVFTLYLSIHKSAVVEKRQKSYWLQAIFMYLVIGLGFVSSLLASQGGIVKDAQGLLYNQKDIRESAVVVMLFTMLFVSLLSLIQVVKSKVLD